MADLTANAPLRFKGEMKAQRWVLDNSAAQTIYKGHPMIIDIGTDTSYPRLFDSGVTLATGDAFIGFAAEYCNVLTTDTETDNKIDIVRPPSILGFADVNSLTRANIGD